MSETFVIPAMGWLPDYPDIRDVTFQSERVPSKLQALGQPSVKQMLAKVGATTSAPAALPTSVDLRPWCSPIEDQKTIGSCTAHAGVGLVEYFERRAFGKHLDASRLFLYKVTRNLLKWTGDTGAFLRSTMYALTLFGVPPEEYYPYNIADFDKEPSAFCYAFGQSYQAISYYRLDPPGTTRSNLLTQIKTYLANGLPSMFGFTVYSSISQANTNGGKIPYPTPGERVLGGHAIDAVGYDDNLKIKNTNAGGIETTGALLIRNSWGTGWGSAGYGWLPYKYVLDGLATDWWSLIKSEWIDTGQFG
ncbi:C1 family peptidase [Microcystis aeruginosa]|jgi:C1A family cysteine protease|uniref:Papain family cysteine protease n=1 Tax=Microcystis aeruginosa SPC777 TaxID=482300 RepID=S3J5Y1_MICAE|nr:C1 family peptidase [Microcystis aeruginosa]NCR98121.1 cysteine protease [Microcystis aeruginosa L311-01]OCY15568.1 MAG: cysteine protease [Microcystis aeruginosa CACIAM 03]TRU08838.1 MAG: cysteine protease [Microcystis aeruginosa Ma_MB_F_20061100_S19D]TRU09856.1 MAG: cysteine protease [Microcystis aeruginosa Ma_MB_F_20061100_S19]EPF20056.1 Papain family cysteine protease [Microcystis aeruginosa SPC777]